MESNEDYFDRLASRINEQLDRQLLERPGLDLVGVPVDHLARALRTVYSQYPPEEASEYRLVVDWGGNGFVISAQDGEVPIAIYIGIDGPPELEAKSFIDALVEFDKRKRGWSNDLGSAYLERMTKPVDLTPEDEQAIHDLLRNQTENDDKE